MLDGMCKIEEAIIKARQMGQKCIAITDHGHSSGLFEAYKLGKKHEFNVLLGEEFYFQNKCEELKTGHLILIAKNEKGLANIFTLQKLAYDNVYYKPRINIEMLKLHHEGLVCTTACIANQIGQFILRDEPHLALNHILELKELFGEDFYVELQSTTNEDVIKVNLKLEEFIKDYNLKTIITTDAHYVNKEDYDIHEVMLCMQQQKKISDPKRWKFTHNDYWLKNEEEMLNGLGELREETISKAFRGIEEIFEKCKDVEIKGGNYLPKFLPTKEEEDMALYTQTMENYFGKITERSEANPDFMKDLQKELRVIKETGYSGYFLIVQEYVNWAKNNGILVGDGRGSGAGSKVAYTIGITDVNPQEHNLLFERFLSPGREPDFDVDFSDIDAVFKHLQEQYGKDNVARVGAITRFTAKSLIRKVMGAYSFSQTEIKNVTSRLPNELKFTFEEALNQSAELTSWFDKHSNLKRIVYRLEGIIDHTSTHAGGVIICNELMKLLPVITDSDNRDKMIVMLDKKELESLGHYKFDVLGLISLQFQKLTEKYTGKIDWHEVDFEDKNIYNMLCKGDVEGVFQLSGQAEKVVQQQPKNFNDLVAINALIRPGVCDWGEYLKRRAEHKTSELEYMNSTHGLIVYQDQYLLLAQTYAGWGIAFSDKNIRKNKNLAEDFDLKAKFLTDGQDNGYELSELTEVWKEIVSVAGAGYGFNMAHATSYARLCFQTAYMKYYHPKEFYAAYMTINHEESAMINSAINKLKTMDIKVLPPDINASADEFVPTEEGIRFPLTAIKGVGGSAMYEINRLKPIKSFDDFMERRVKKFIKIDTIAALIKAGSFDFDNNNRYELLQKINTNLTKQKNCYYEREALGFYLSDNPLDRFNAKPFNEFPQGAVVTTVGEVMSVKTVKDKRGNEMAFVIIQNSTDTIELVIFSSVWGKNKMEEGQLVLLKGKKDISKILVNSFEVIV